MHQQAKGKLVGLFQTHHEMARLAYKRKTKYINYLKLTGARQTKTNDPLMQTETFYANVPVAIRALPRTPPGAVRNGATDNADARVAGPTLPRHVQSQVRTLTQTRTQALEDLQTWMRRFIAHISDRLKNSP